MTATINLSNIELDTGAVTVQLKSLNILIGRLIASIKLKLENNLNTIRRKPYLGCLKNDALPHRGALLLFYSSAWKLQDPDGLGNFS